MNEQAGRSCPKTSNGQHVWRQFGTPAEKSATLRCFACGAMGDRIEGEWYFENGLAKFRPTDRPDAEEENHRRR